MSHEFERCQSKISNIWSGHRTAQIDSEKCRKINGRLGSCRDYLANTVAELAVLGIDEPGLTALLQEVDAIAARDTSQNAPEP